MYNTGLLGDKPVIVRYTDCSATIMVAGTGASDTSAKKADRTVRHLCLWSFATNVVKLRPPAGGALSLAFSSCWLVDRMTDI